MAAKAKQPPQEGNPAERHYYPTPKQQIALDCTCQTILFGGARGGGGGRRAPAGGAPPPPARGPGAAFN